MSKKSVFKTGKEEDTEQVASLIAGFIKKWMCGFVNILFDLASICNMPYMFLALSAELTASRQACVLADISQNTWKSKEFSFQHVPVLLCRCTSVNKNS